MKKLLVLLAFFSTIQFSEMLAEDNCNIQSGEVSTEDDCKMYEQEVTRSNTQICYRLVVYNDYCEPFTSNNTVCMNRECYTSGKEGIFSTALGSYTCTVIVEGRNCNPSPRGPRSSGSSGSNLPGMQ